MKPGTIVKLPDGREGTVVYSSLEGYGIVWGRRAISESKLLECNPLLNVKQPDFAGEEDCPEPEAMLRDERFTEKWGIECVGESYEIVSQP